ncbi:HAD family hydrolase [Pararhodonellum marinum]|uniref:HAD family hydrolase n=1 Tax=Pararhodonellum marinum TaxID=2755358 RepID=UPI0018904753|nr:HAD family phosphatase [Pararhodonellum marinum]
MNKHAVIFDMDGVICHTNPYHSKAFKTFFAKRELYPTEEEFSQHMYGKSNSYILRHFLKREIPATEFYELEDEKESLFREIYAPHVQPIAGFQDFLDQLKQAGLSTGVATSAPRANLDMIMGKLAFDRHMESILASENVTKHKPDPEVYLKSAQNLGISPDKCMVFEDSFSGVSAAINAGMKVIAVLSSHKESELPPCDAYINSFKEIQLKDLWEIWER